MEYIYAALLLHKLGKPITEEHLKKVIEAAGTQPDEAQIKSLIASLKGVDIEKAMAETTMMTAAPTAAQPAKAEEKKEEKKAEEAAEGLSALFG